MTEVEVERVMSGGVQGNTPPFYSLERWKPTIRLGNRTVWVHCWGIPLHAWDRNYIRQIVAGMGVMVDVDDDVEVKRRMDRARVLIRTPWSPLINHVIEVHIDGEMFKVHAVEECGPMVCENHTGGRCYSDSSEEIESTDSLAGDDFSEPTRLEGAHRDQWRDTSTDQLPNSPHKITLPNAGAGEHIETRITTGCKEDDYLMDKVVVSWLMTGVKDPITVNSSIEVHALENPPLESHLNNHESRVAAFHENRQREKGESSGLQKQLHQPSRDSAEDKGPSKGKEAYIAHAENETGISLGQ